MKPPRLSFHEALHRIREVVPAGPCENIAVSLANGRVLAESVTARRDCPPFAMSAMDGYAIGSGAIHGSSPRRLWLGKPQFAGDPPTILQEGEARPIFTGAAIPLGTGAVLVQEQAVISGNDLILSEPLLAGANIRRAGEDAHTGERVLDAPCRLHPAMLGALCSYDAAQLTVRKRPRIVMLVLGDELADAGGAADDRVIDANSPMIAAMLADAGCDIVQVTRIGDDEQAIRCAIEQARSAGIDMMLSSGGASVGARDLLRPSVEGLGATIHFHGVHMRPGKPALFATLPCGLPIFGLPGNPVAALVAARFFVMAALRSIYALPPEPPALPWDGDCDTGPTRILKLRVDGSEIHMLPGQKSHMLRPLLQANSWGVRGGGRRSSVFCFYDLFA